MEHKLGAGARARPPYRARPPRRARRRAAAAARPAIRPPLRWRTQLYASWGNGASGCEELATSNGVKAGVWTHVAAVFDESAVRLYVNGSLADSATAGGYRRIVGGRSPVERPLSCTCSAGMHPDGLHGLVGQLDEVARARCSAPPTLST